jgi:hypothetical protein
VGNKVHTAVAVSGGASFSSLVQDFEPCLGGVKLRLLPDFASIVLNPANQIIHPARYWGIFKDWSGAPLNPESIPWLYRSDLMKIYSCDHILNVLFIYYYLGVVFSLILISPSFIILPNFALLVILMMLLLRRLKGWTESFKGSRRRC